MSDFVNTADEMGDMETVKSILDGTIEHFADDSIDYLMCYAFGGASGGNDNRISHLQSVDLPNLTIMEAYAFANCINLTSVNLPKLERAQEATVEYNTTPANGNFFMNCVNLETISLPSYQANQKPNYGAPSTYYMFRGCTKLKNVDLPEVTHLDQYTFNGCTALQYLYLPKLTSMSNYVFYQCSNLKTLILPSMRSFSFDCLNGSNATQLRVIDFRGCGHKVTYSDTTGNLPPSSIVQIIVDDEYYDEYAADTRWSRYMQYIVKASEYVE